MELLDIHTHNSAANSRFAILSCDTYIPERTISLGLHPWYASAEWRETFTAIEQYAGNNNVAAIGECGIDALRSTLSLEEQAALLRAHALLAERVQKPLILHCVKAFDAIVALHKEISPKQAWIIHGFRGKPQQATQLTKRGFYLSFGEKFNKESLIATPAKKLFIESDESPQSIATIYSSIAAAMGTTVEELAGQTMKNCHLFGQF
jgi:TatD DNase family protein